MAHAVIVGCRFIEAIGKVSNCANLVPQVGQNEAYALTSFPQLGQNGIASPPVLLIHHTRTKKGSQ
jgi:predicted fused transcriptional regulator/phosphomethylpyrimidine kinase